MNPAGYAAQTLIASAALNDPIELATDVVLLPGRAEASPILSAVAAVVGLSPWRRMQVPGGGTMSVAMSNCGDLGWVSDARGYRYQANDPLNNQRWPNRPEIFTRLANNRAAEAGFTGSGSADELFNPDACLLNAYRQAAKLSLHQDSNEQDFSHPIVSVSLGASARFLIGGNRRSDPTTAVMLSHGDVLVWGRSARLMHHGVGVPRVRTAPNNLSPVPGDFLRINLTFRRAG